MSLPLMPKATAVWLVDNTTLTFEQIGAFVGMHPLEVKGIADGEVAQGIVGQDPILNGQITREELKLAEANPQFHMRLLKPLVDVTKSKAGARYTPVSKRQDKPNAVAWIAKFHPEVSDAQIGKLLGTTKKTITEIRNRTHWNMAQIKPQDPVTVGICSQMQLDDVVRIAQEKRAAREKKAEKAALAKAAALGTPLPAAPMQDATDDEEDAA